jgi:hypothetical protein
MKSDQIPYYTSDGIPLGFHSLARALRLVAGRFVMPSYGPKGHLRAIWLAKEDGGNPVETHARTGTRYTFLQNLDSGGRCYSFRPVDQRDESGAIVSMQGAFLQVVADCTPVS